MRRGVCAVLLVGIQVLRLHGRRLVLAILILRRVLLVVVVLLSHGGQLPQTGSAAGGRLRLRVDICHVSVGGEGSRSNDRTDSVLAVARALSSATPLSAAHPTFTLTCLSHRDK
jgi:uncharacterized SAM-binding protein YcdF (DUF218 family)